MTEERFGVWLHRTRIGKGFSVGTGMDIRRRDGAEPGRKLGEYYVLMLAMIVPLIVAVIAHEFFGINQAWGWGTLLTFAIVAGVWRRTASVTVQWLGLLVAGTWLIYVLVGLL